MLFSGSVFLYFFLPGALLLYTAAPKKLKNTVLLAVSLFFYYFGEPVYVLLMILACISGYTHGILIERSRGARQKKALLISSVLISLSLLAFFKYADFFIENINAVSGAGLPLLKLALPIGISFYTFQSISYTADVYRGDVKAQRNIIDFSAYLTFFPQLIAGPIVRYADMEPQLKDREITPDTFAYGVRRFAVGFGKKLLIANALGECAESCAAAAEQSVLLWWLYAAAYTMQVYFDFSGYSDMAIGLGRMFGFRLPENFRYPLTAKSITDFWRRWHITLGSWFRDYLYIPLGGNRVNTFRWVTNILIVWAATGLWHGAAWNFAAWGVYFAVLLILEKKFFADALKKRPFIAHIYVAVTIGLSFVLFGADSITEAIHHFQMMFFAAGLPVLNSETAFILRNYAVTLILSAIAATPLAANTINAIKTGRAGEKIINVLTPFFCIAVIVIGTGYLVDGSFNPFLYFRF